MHRNRITLAGAMIIAGSMIAATGQAVLFEDGTFETPISSLSDGTGWEGTGVSVEDWANGAPGTGGAFGYAAGGDGQNGMVFRGFTDASGQFYHDVPVESSRQYDFHIQSHTAVQFYNQVVASGSGTVAIVFAWYDNDPTGGGMIVGTLSNDITSSITDGGGDGEFPAGPSRAVRWQDWDYTGLIPPAGATYLRTTIQWTSPAPVTGGDEVVRWDNAQLTTTLDPLNDSVGPQPVLELSFQTQEFVDHRVESAEDLVAGFSDAGLPLVVGNDQTQQVYTLPATPVQAYRLLSER